MMLRKINTLLILIAVFVLTGCGIYSFTGASIPAEAKTVSIQYFPNNANLVNQLLFNILPVYYRLIEDVLAQLVADGAHEVILD